MRPPAAAAGGHASYATMQPSPPPAYRPAGGYGAYSNIPFSSPPPAMPAPAASPEMQLVGVVSSVRSQAQALLASRRPLPEFLYFPAFSLPSTLAVAMARSRRNLAYFRANYAIVVLAAVATGFVFHPFSLISLAILITAWYFLYFGRSPGPLVLLGRDVDDGAVLAALVVVTVVCAVFSELGMDIAASVATGAVIVGAHSVVRSTDDLYLDEREASAAGLVGIAVADAAAPVLTRYVRV